MEVKCECNHPAVKRGLLRCPVHTPVSGSYKEQVAELKAKVAELEAELAESNRRHNDLIMQVMNKHPNETRHETAKRYIYQAEHQNNPPTAALREGNTDG